jgi:hypothetical protein
VRAHAEVVGMIEPAVGGNDVRIGRQYIPYRRVGRITAGEDDRRTVGSFGMAGRDGVRLIDVKTPGSSGQPG